jgi:hypothetical protein
METNWIKHTAQELADMASDDIVLNEFDVMDYWEYNEVRLKGSDIFLFYDEIELEAFIESLQEWKYQCLQDEKDELQYQEEQWIEHCVRNKESEINWD